jgi:ubiquinone/menaquinone biosynthesis C-methylase UbiE
LKKSEQRDFPFTIYHFSLPNCRPESLVDLNSLIGLKNFVDKKSRWPERNEKMKNGKWKMENLGLCFHGDMIPCKTNKELAYLHELFVANDWGERFAELIDEHVELPKEGQALYLASGTGGHAIALQERANEKLTFHCLAENEESLELARAKAAVLKDGTQFLKGKVDELSSAANQFNLVVGDGSLIHSQRVPRMLAEMVRVAAPNASVALVLPTFSSFAEFFSIYWEALHNCGLLDHEADVEALICTLPSVSAVETMAEQAGLDEIESWTRIEEFDYESGEQFLSASLINDFLTPIWLETLPGESRKQVKEEIARLINKERHEAEFALSVKATLVTGKKPLIQ